MDITEEKKILRGRMKEILRTLSVEEKKRVSQDIINHLQILIVNNQINMIASFVPFAHEPDMQALMTSCIQQGIGVVVPDQPHTTYHFAPRDQLQSIIDHPISLMIVPGVAFTRSGKRLGRGGGRYDRMIAQVRQNNPTCLVVGVCFAQQLVDDLPTEPHDQLMDEVVFA